MLGQGAKDEAQSPAGCPVYLCSQERECHCSGEEETIMAPAQEKFQPAEPGVQSRELSRAHLCEPRSAGLGAAPSWVLDVT